MGNSPLFFRFNNIVSAKWADNFTGVLSQIIGH